MVVEDSDYGRIRQKRSCGMGKVHVFAACLRTYQEVLCTMVEWFLHWIGISQCRDVLVDKAVECLVQEHSQPFMRMHGEECIEKC